MEISEIRKNGVLVVDVGGRIDASNAGLLETRLVQLINGGNRHLVVDCARLDYVSSAGLRALLVAAKRLAGNRGKIVLAALKEPIKEVFDIAGFASILEIYRTPDDAVAALQ